MTTTLDQKIIAFQIKEIMRNCSYQVDIKNEWVQWVTGDSSRTSLKSITHDQAIKIMHAQTGNSPLLSSQGTKQSRAAVGEEENWAVFDKSNPKHKVILSLLYQMQWVKPNEKYGEVPDLERLSQFLKSDKSPVKKKLKDMEPQELEKTIKALNGIVKHRYK